MSLTKDTADNSEITLGATQRPLINISEILTPDPNEDQLTSTQIAQRTINRLVPFVLPLLLEEEVKLALSKSQGKDELIIRQQIAAELIDNMGWLAPFGGSFDESSFLTVSRYGNLRPLEVAAQLGLVQRQEGTDNRYTISTESKNLFGHLLT